MQDVDWVGCAAVEHLVALCVGCELKDTSTELEQFFRVRNPKLQRLHRKQQIAVLCKKCFFCFCCRNCLQYSILMNWLKVKQPFPCQVTSEGSFLG